MNADAERSTPQSALSTVVNVVVVPQAAFDSIRERPTWFVAFVVVSLLSMAGSLLSVPAMSHAVRIWYPAQLAADPNSASLPPERVAQLTDFTVAVIHYQWLANPIIVLLGALLTAVVLLVVCTIAKGDAGFNRLFALAMNVGVVTLGLFGIVTGTIVALRGSDAFASPLEVQAAIPSLAWLAPAAGPKVMAALSAVNPFTIWSFVLLALGTATVARVSRAVGFAASAAVTVLGVAFTVAVAR